MGCTPSALQVRLPPGEAIQKAQTRLNERGIRVDQASAQAHRFHSAMYCFRERENRPFTWDSAFARQVGPPIGFSHVGAADEQDKKAQECPFKFRVRITAAQGETTTKLDVTPEWWRLVRGRCLPHGPPALAKQLCKFSYRGAIGPRDPRGFIFGILNGL